MRENQHTFVVINFNIKLKGKVIITMTNYIKEFVHDLKNITGLINPANTPGNQNLFEANDNAEQ